MEERGKEASPERSVPELMAKLLHARETWSKNEEALRAWLDSTPEEALEPELEIVDPHHHAWDMRDARRKAALVQHGRAERERRTDEEKAGEG